MDAEKSAFLADVNSSVTQSVAGFLSDPKTPWTADTLSVTVIPCPLVEPVEPCTMAACPMTHENCATTASRTEEHVRKRIMGELGSVIHRLNGHCNAARYLMP